jgi:cytochrome c5
MTDFEKLQNAIAVALEEQGITGVDVYKMTCTVYMGHTYAGSPHTHYTTPPERKDE